MEDAVIVSAVRTPVVASVGSSKDLAATDLGAQAVRAALERVEIAGEEVDEVVLGCVLQAGLGQNPARQVAIGAGIPKEVPATTINMVCGSGLKAVAIASQMIRAGDAHIVVAGGMENMTRPPYLIPSGRFGARMGDAELIDSMVHDGLWDAFNAIHMGITAENLAERYRISREEQDEFAARSQQKAERAGAEGAFADEIVSIAVPAKGGTRMVDSDEAPRSGTTGDSLGKLRAAFRRDGGTVTAGNSSGINDGAAAIVVMSASKANERGLQPFGTIESYAAVGVEPKIMGLGPVPAIRKARSRGPGLSWAKSISSSSTRRSRRSHSPCSGNWTSSPNGSTPHGGAIALGHPIGASGGRILVTLVHEMRRRGSARGLRWRWSRAGGDHPQRRRPVAPRGHEQARGGLYPARPRATRAPAGEPKRRSNTSDVATCSSLALERNQDKEHEDG